MEFHSVYLRPFYMRGTSQAPVPPLNLTWYAPRMYLGYPMMPAYTFLTTKAYVQTTWFEQPILIPLMLYHMMQHDSYWCNFMLLWSWNTPVMPVLTSGPTTRSLENKGMSKRSITQDMWQDANMRPCLLNGAPLARSRASLWCHMMSYDIIWHHMIS